MKVLGQELSFRYEVKGVQNREVPLDLICQRVTLASLWVNDL